jgi:hypothetical protein
MDGLSNKKFKDSLKQYRHDVPSVGKVDYATVEQFLSEGRICRGWTQIDGQLQYFHIIRSPGYYPEKSIFSGNTENELFQITIHLGMQHGIDFEKLFAN